MSIQKQSLKADQFASQYLSQKPYILDVRSSDEFNSCHIPTSINLPLDKIEQGAQGFIPRDQPVFLLCQSGMRSERARKILEAQGYHNLICIEGGIKACSQTPGLVSQKKIHFPIMRQVQIAAGFLSLLGIVLSYFIHPSFLFLTLFVSCGLIFAGLTGFCGMAILLEKMPWNKIS